FVHLLGVVTLFGAITIIQWGGARLRGAATIEQVRLWVGFLRTTERMFPAATLLLLASGVYMTTEAWTFETPWIAVSIAGLLVMPLLGARVVGRQMSAIARSVAGAEGVEVPSEVKRLIATPAGWQAAFALNGIALGILWVMAIKPGLIHSIVVVLGLGFLGAMAGYLVTRPRSS
ncbi:MAG: DUF2269 domain-containing protein, partial [Actinomycetota bacterium]|nr:DUF2269 domain-containing protein [Actinomycetota bacterium]